MLKVWHIFDGDPLYVLGHIERISTPSDLMRWYPREDEFAQRLKERYSAQQQYASNALKLWKQTPSLRARFDTDGDGQLNEQELDRAREEAQRIAAKQRQWSTAPAKESTIRRFGPSITLRIVCAGLTMVARS